MNADKATRQHFDALSRDEKIQAVCGMADTVEAGSSEQEDFDDGIPF